jgi:hypothetical protein
LEFLDNECPWKILFIHCREPEEIKRLVDDFKCSTLLITNNNITQVESNHADANVNNYNYDFVIHNDGTLEDLKVEVELFILELFNGEE